MTPVDASATFQPYWSTDGTERKSFRPSENYFVLSPPSSYSKRFATKFKKFDTNSDVISIGLDDFNTKLTGIYFAKSKKEFKKAQKSDSAFVYDLKKGKLYFNKNGSSKKFGDGGLIARFEKNTRLNDEKFIFNSGINSTSIPDPMPALAATSPPEATPEPPPEPTPVLEYGETATYTKEENPIYARVYGYGGNTGTYEIALRTVQVAIAEASSLDEDGTYEGSISSEGETDYFEINAGKRDSISLRLTSDSGLYPLLAIVDAQGEVLSELTIHNGYGSSYYDLEKFNLPDSPGSLYLRVKSQLNSSTGGYSINFFSDPSFESKKTYAPVFNGDGSYQGSILGLGETDYFKISDDTGDIISLSLTSNDELYPLLAIVDADGKTIPSISKPNGYGANNYDMKLFEFPSSVEPVYLEIRTQNDSYIGEYTLYLVRRLEQISKMK